MIVCVCKRINSAQIKDAVDKGVTDVGELATQLGLGTGCGRCVEFTRQLVREQAQLIHTEAVA